MRQIDDYMPRPLSLWCRPFVPASLLEEDIDGIIVGLHARNEVSYAITAAGHKPDLGALPIKFVQKFTEARLELFVALVIYVDLYHRVPPI
jgi:hypothetical protein